MTLEENIKAILDTYFCGFRAELIEACAKRIMEQIKGQADTPLTDCAVMTDTSYQVLDGWQTRDKPKTTDCGWK